MEQKKLPPEGPRKTHGLNSWKEIADYLGVNVRTAQKWERHRGLPVRRGPGLRSRVSADADELDAWRRRLVNRTPEDRSYQWPLGPAITVETRFLGGHVTAEHVELLRDYLELLKKSIL